MIVEREIASDAFRAGFEAGLIGAGKSDHEVDRLFNTWFQPPPNMRRRLRPINRAIELHVAGSTMYTLDIEAARALLGLVSYALSLAEEWAAGYPLGGGMDDKAAAVVAEAIGKVTHDG